MQIDRFEDVLRALREHPEWLDELRQLVFTNELIALPELVVAQGRVQAEHTATLAEHTARLSDIDQAIARIEIRLDDAVGVITEERYRNEAYGYFGAIARRIRQLAGPALDDVLEPLEADGLLDARERLELLASDGIFEGRRDGVPVRLVMEASMVVDTDDVRRARERADLLSRTGTMALAVAAGRSATDAARRLARSTGVWVVTNGRADAPDVTAPGTEIHR